MTVPHSQSSRRAFLGFTAAGAAAVSAPALSAPARSRSPGGRDAARRIDNLARSLVREGFYPGMAVAVEKDGHVLYAEGLGLADVENKVPVDADTVFPVGSITKSFTALAFHQLADQGRVSIDDTVSRWLPEYKGPGRDVALRHLLNHTSGIPNYTSLPDFPKDQQQPRSHEETLSYLTGKSLKFGPGVRFSYSNSNTFLIGMIVEKVSGRAYADYLGTHVFGPFGMARSFVADYRPIITNRARGYERAGDGWVNADQYDVGYPFAAGAVQSTVGDLLKYRRGVFEQSPESLRRRLLAQDRLADGTLNYYALGCLIVREAEGHRKVSHSGNISGASAHYAWYPDDRTTIVVLTNLGQAPIMPYAVERKIARAARGDAQPVIVDKPVGAAELKAFAGDWNVEPFEFDAPVFGFVAEGGRLWLRYGGVGSKAPLMKLLHQGGGRFVTAEDSEHSFTFEGDRLRSEFFDGEFFASRS